jgi:hypothetical protein
MNLSYLSRLLATFCLLAPVTAGFSQVTLVEQPVSTSTNAFYIGNRPPLAAFSVLQTAHRFHHPARLAAPST